MRKTTTNPMPDPTDETPGQPPRRSFEEMLAEAHEDQARRKEAKLKARQEKKAAALEAQGVSALPQQQKPRGNPIEEMTDEDFEAAKERRRQERQDILAKKGVSDTG